MKTTDDKNSRTSQPPTTVPELRRRTIRPREREWKESGHLGHGKRGGQYFWKRDDFGEKKDEKGSEERSIYDNSYYLKLEKMISRKENTE